ncbi:restriction endonuclease subunit S [Yersinia enterocolitica]
MSADNKVPEIRFEGFSGEWEEKAICDLFTVTRGNVLSATKTSPIPTPDKRYPVYSSQTKNNGLMGFYDKYLFENAITWTTDGANAGTVNFRDDKFYSTNVNGVLLSDEGYANKAIAEILNKEAWRHVSHVGNPKLMNNVMSAIKITIPNSVEEQTTIGNYFQKLDTQINQHQQKHDKLNNIKKAMLEKMFPKKGETIPEIRFKGFSGEWDEISLLDSIEQIIDFRGRTPKKLGLDWSTSGYRALSALNVKQGYIDFSIDPHFGDQELYDKWMSGSELHQGQVLFTTEAPMGNVAQVPNTDKYILSQRTIAFITKSETIAEDFLAVLLRSSKVFRELSALSSGGTAKGVSQKVLANLIVSIPTDLIEQTAIGNYFQKLDNLINRHQQQITKLNNIKQACLSKMFV